jgi:CO dehydrogenase/acetyl-CoA synthase epsilon subunit
MIVIIEVNCTSYILHCKKIDVHQTNKQTRDEPVNGLHGDAYSDDIDIFLGCPEIGEKSTRNGVTKVDTNFCVMMPLLD